MESVNIDFTNGISAVMDPNLIGKGFAVFLENVDLSGITAQSVRAPAFIMDAADGVKDIFEYRGKWHLTTTRREWLAEYVGRQERLYYKDLDLAATDRRPYKVIDGVAAPLGTIRPKVMPVVSDLDMLTTINVSAILVPGVGRLPEKTLMSYRIGLRTSRGLLPASNPVTIYIPDYEDDATYTASAKITWTQVLYTDLTKEVYEDVQKIVIFGRTAGSEQIIAEVDIDTFEWTDDGSEYPAGAYAKTQDAEELFFYYYTFQRDTNGHVDESGPSPIFGPMDTYALRKISRSPMYEGLFEGCYTFAAAGLTTAQTVQSGTIVGKEFRRVSKKTVITTLTAHARSTGDKVGILHTHSGADSKVKDQIYGVSVPTADLPKPAIVTFEDGAAASDGWTQGTSLDICVTAFRGAGWDDCYGGAPAETAIVSADHATLTVGAPIDGVNLRAKAVWSFASADHDGFHVYLNGGLIATVAAGTTFLEFGTDTPDMTKTPPATNTSRTRALVLDATAKDIAWDEALSASTGRWGYIAYDPYTKVTMVDPTVYTPAKGDLLFFSSTVSELGGGYYTVDIDATKHGTITTGDFYIQALTEANHALTGVQTCKIAGPVARFINKWNLYVARADTGNFLLQGSYDIDKTEVLDWATVDYLGGTCGSDYTAIGRSGESISVTFEPPPTDLHDLTLHGNSLFGIVDRTLRWTPPNRPDAWPDAYTRPFAYEPYRTVSYGGTLLVLCADGVYRVDGTDPSALECHKTLSEDGIISPYSAQATAAGLVYLSQRGLVAYRAETNNTTPISEGKMDSDVLLGASGTPEDDLFSFWCIPSRRGAFWAKLTRDLPAADPDRVERIISNNLALTWPLPFIRSFYHRGKYYLYYPQQAGVANAFRMHGMVCVDTTRKGYPMTLLGIKPVSAHVSENGRAYLLMRDPEVYVDPETPSGGDENPVY